MSFTTDVQKTLFRLYEHYVGEPDSAKDVYGYWLFILGYMIGAAGVFVFVVGYAGNSSYFQVRVSGVTAASGLSLCLFGLVLMLPVRKRAIQASALGLVISLVGVASFGVVYPRDWYGYGAELTVEVVTIYATGIAIIAGVTALVPVITGRKGMFVEEEGATDDPDILTGEALEGAQFAVFRDENGDWKWHVLHLEALAASDESAVTRPDAESDIERVKSQIGSAGLMELTTSAFRLYEGQDDRWRWTLVRDDGSVVADCAATFDERDGAEQSVSFLKDRGPGADVIEIEGAAFTYTEERDRWTWELLDDDRRPLAESATRHATQASAEEAATMFADRFDRARVLDVEHVGVELRDGEDGWTWRFVDDADEELAESTIAFDGRRDAEETVETLLPELSSAPVTVAGEPTYERYQSGEQWRWRLVDESEHVVARSPDDVASFETIERGSEAFGDHAEGADVVEIDDADYEVYPAENPTPGAETTDLPATVDDDDRTDGSVDGETGADDPVTVEEAGPDWHWRLVTEDREVIAASTEPHVDAEDAAEAIDRVREQAREADLIEFEEAAFQVYEAESGEWRWRLIDEDGNVLADSGAEHTSRSDAAEAMMTLKEQAPDAELLEIDTAAFELFVNEDDRWGWRLIDEAGKLVAEDPATHPDRASARRAMDRLLDHLEADIREMDRAIFQTHPADDDWHWRFVLPDGDVVARSADGSATRDELVDGLGEVREAAANGQGYTIGDVAVQVYGNGEWRFRLLDRDREVIAESSVSYPGRDAAMDAVAEVERHVESAPIFTIETAAIRLGHEDGEGWTWELIDPDREVLARAASAERTKPDLIERVDELRRLVALADRVDFDVASFELFAETVSEDGDSDPAADGDSEPETRWRWRLIDEDGRTVATGTEHYSTSDAAREALASVRDLIGSASILEIDSVSFELHAHGDGWIWHLVDRHGETMSESTRTYESRTEAREAMNAVKAHAPGGWITFTE